MLLRRKTVPIYYDLGKITIQQREITITTATATKKYESGVPLTDPTYTVEGLVDGHKAQVTVTGSQLQWGSSYNTVDPTSIKILNEAGQDVTGNYKISLVLGKLTVNLK